MRTHLLLLECIMANTLNVAVPRGKLLHTLFSDCGTLVVCYNAPTKVDHQQHRMSYIGQQFWHLCMPILMSAAEPLLKTSDVPVRLCTMYSIRTTSIPIICTVIRHSHRRTHVYDLIIVIGFYRPLMRLQTQFPASCGQTKHSFPQWRRQ